MKNPDKKTHVSLFTGVGGFDKAADWMGWENVAHCEWNAFGKHVLNYNWPYSKAHHDIKSTDFTVYRNSIFIVSGGFPCQPYSLAGLRKGKEDERHLWPEMLRTIREIAPPWVVGENVRGLINWDGGLVFHEVQADLEAEGYEVLPFLLPAAGVNAPHERYRIWFIAYSHNARTNYRGRTDNKRTQENEGRQKQSQPEYRQNGGNGIITDPQGIGRRKRLRENVNGEGWEDTEHIAKGGEVRNWDKTISGTGIFTDTNGIGWRGEIDRVGESRQFNKDGPADYWGDFPTQSPVCNGDDGFPTESLRQRIREDSMGVISEEEIDKILSKALTEWRSETIKAGGNAVVPQEVYQIFKAIEQYDNMYVTTK